MCQWPLEGRDAELAMIREAFESKTVNALIVTSTAGMGKTRLAREALNQLRCDTLWMAATRAAAAIPFAAVADLLPDDLPPAVAPAGLIRAVVARVASLGGRTKVAIGVDDAHLLDDASSTAIARIIVSGAAFAVLTVRTDERLADCLANLGKDGEAAVLALSALPDAAIDRLIDHGTDSAIDPPRRHRLRIGARGNPLALRELLYGAEPGGITELVKYRLNSLDPRTRGVVELVACGEPLPLEFLERLASPEAIADAENSGLVIGERSGTLLHARLDHPLFGDVLRQGMAVARSRQIYRDLARQLIDAGTNRPEDALRAAWWQVQGGDVTHPDLVRAGARQAIGRSGLVLAEELARAARDAEPCPEADWLLAEILEYQGRSGEAAALLPVTPPTDPADRIRWVVARANWLYWGTGDLSAATATWDAAGGHSIAEGARAFTLFFAGRCAQTLPIADDLLTEDSHPQAVVWAAAAATASLGFLGRIDKVDAVRERGVAVAIAHATSLPWGTFQMEVATCLAYLASGYLEKASVVAARGYQSTVETGVPMMISTWALYGGIVSAAQGHLAEAHRRITESHAGFGRADTFRLRRLCFAADAWVSALRGQYRDAATQMARADELDHRTNQVFDPWIMTWRGWIAHATGDLATATAFTAKGAALAATLAMPGVEAQAHYDTIRLGGTVDLARLAALPGEFPSLLGTAAHALADADAAALSRVADALAVLGHHLLAAELAATAGRTLRRHGQRGAAALAMANAASLRQRCGGARTPLLAHDDLGVVLTPRERQVARLATRHTSRQIAAKLGLALPTVNNTLSRAYVKLGIASRDELRTLLGE